MPAWAGPQPVDAPDVDLALEQLHQDLSAPLETLDASPALTAIAHIGDDLDPDTDTVVAPASGRVKVEVCHTGDAGRMWLGVGQVAQVGVGNWLEPGDVWSEFTDEDVHVLLDNTAEAQRVTGMEWAA